MFVVGALGRPSIIADNFAQQFGPSMFYRPSPDVGSGQKSRVDWVQDPTKKRPENGLKRLDVDRIQRVPLTPGNRKIVETSWAACSASLEKFPDFMGSFDAAGFVTTQTIADEIERLEPSVHEMIPLSRVWSLESKARSERKFVFINVSALVETVNLEKSQISRGTVQATGEEFVSLSAMVPESCVVYPQAGEGRHLWCDKATKAMFMSATLKQFIAEHGTRGVYFVGSVPDVH